ncbi:unnamed protein product [Larinioides sclopetarius]|uniref:Uncharacterized protein n=1 Tax=Larinioides sclopetarius TaxID=280406 RepID=A0AAV2A6D4_9ARAC
MLEQDIIFKFVGSDCTYMLAVDSSPVKVYRNNMVDLLDYVVNFYFEIQTAQELYYAADKYELQGLKNICNKILVNNLDTNNAIDVLLGHKHSDSELKYTSIKFIAENAQEIQYKKEWMVFMKNYLN